MDRNIQSSVVTIAASGTQSEAIPVKRMAFGTLETPSAISGNTYTIEGRFSTSGDSSTWKPITDSSGNALTMTLTANKIVRIPDAAFPCDEIRLVSDTTEAAERSFVAYLET